MKFGEGYVLAKFAKACPFCGSKRIRTMTHERYDNLHFSDTGYNSIECKGCGAFISNCTMHESSYSESYSAVLKLWNKRASA